MIEEKRNVPKMPLERKRMKFTARNLIRLRWINSMPNAVKKIAIVELFERMDALSKRFKSREFRYNDSNNCFDHRKSYGLVVRLIHVKDPRVVTAFEFTAGDRLFQFVVDADGNCKDLLQHGRLLRRVTILSLNKIRHDVLSDNKLQVEYSVQIALSLAGYNQEAHNSIEQVFPRTVICPDLMSAKPVTFDNRLKTRTVPLEGDTYDPSGTASGGACSRPGSSVLSLLSQLKDT